jgi:hypothetical protein
MSERDEESLRIDDDELLKWLEIRAAKGAAKDHERLAREAALVTKMQELDGDEQEAKAFQRHLRQGQLAGKPRDGGAK